PDNHANLHSRDPAAAPGCLSERAPARVTQPGTAQRDSQLRLLQSRRTIGYVYLDFCPANGTLMERRTVERPLSRAGKIGGVRRWRPSGPVLASSRRLFLTMLRP